MSDPSEARRDPPAERAVPRRRLWQTLVAVLGATAILIGLYAWLPAAGRTDAATLIRLLVGLIVYVTVLAFMFRSIGRSDHPGLRAAEALVVAFVALVVGFAFVYRSLYHGDSQAFSEPLDKVGGIYFALTVFSTVGFGDIVPKTDTARIVVSIQYIFDLVIIVGVARLFVTAAQRARANRGLTSPPALGAVPLEPDADPPSSDAPGGSAG